MKTDTSRYKNKIRQYLSYHGIPITSTDADRIRCMNHDDNKPSAIIYDENIYCPVCAATWDIFELAGLHQGLTTFPEQIEAVKKAVGDLGGETEPVSKPTRKKPKTEYKPVPYDEAKKLFTRDKFLEMSRFSGKNGCKKNNIDNPSDEQLLYYGYGNTLTGAWAYRNESGDVELIDVRFEGGARKKNVVSFYYDGKHVKSANSPVLVYGREWLPQYPDYSVVIVEGAKTAAACKDLIDHGMIPMTWNRGTANVDKADWSCLNDRTVYYLPDDDEPGLKAARRFAEIVPNVKIVPPYERARQIKDKGADAVEILQLITHKELARYIRESEPWTPPEVIREQKMQQIVEDTVQGNTDGYPFRILGTAEDGQAYFLDRHSRVYRTKLDSITDGKLLMLANVAYWANECGTNKMSREDWTFCKDMIIQSAGQIDFDPDNIRGRGAWRESDGRICYHDGAHTVGEYSDRRVFLRKERRQVGIGTPPLSTETIKQMKDAAYLLSFETQADGMRLLAWAALAPFAGALLFRPQAFITGPSASGKSSAEISIVKPLAMPARYNGGKTSGAGYIQDRRKDSGAVVIDEADPDTERKKNYKEELLSIMRQSTSDDTPKSAMGTSDQSGTSYLTRDMFLFLAINPEIDSVADDNRLTRINFKKIQPGGLDWSEKRRRLTAAFSYENCRRIRGMVWNRLTRIIETSERMASAIQDYTCRDHRFAISEGTLMATYMHIWRNMETVTDEDIMQFIEGVYQQTRPEEARDDAVEMVDSILEEKLRVFGDKQKEYSVAECLHCLLTGEIPGTDDTYHKQGLRLLTTEEHNEFSRALFNEGVYLVDEQLGIANSHKGIRRILHASRGYSKMLKRHPKCIDTDRNINRFGAQRKCTIIDCLSDDDVPF